MWEWLYNKNIISAVSNQTKIPEIMFDTNADNEEKDKIVLINSNTNDNFINTKLIPTTLLIEEMSRNYFL